MNDGPLPPRLPPRSPAAVPPPLPLPGRLQSLIESGRWPGTAAATNRQNIEPLVPVERIRAIAPDEDELCLYLPPFQTMAEGIASDPSIAGYWAEFGPVEKIDPERALIIADFGIGSDNPILLDYRRGDEPQVLTIEWSFTEDKEGTWRPNNRWMVLAESFEEFADALGLGSEET